MPRGTKGGEEGMALTLTLTSSRVLPSSLTTGNTRKGRLTFSVMR